MAIDCDVDAHFVPFVAAPRPKPSAHMAVQALSDEVDFEATTEILISGAVSERAPGERDQTIDDI
jgi:hypothetical protein